MSDSAASPPPSPEDLKRWDREFVWHPFTQMAEYEPFIVQSARGCVLTDVDGNEYLDGVSSLWCNVHGHRHPKLDEALRRQLDQVAHVTLLGASNPTSIELARRLVELSPRGLEHVFYSDDGATAVEVALKIAFQYQRQRPDPRPEKTSFLALGDAYHGDTLGDVSVGGMDLFHRMFHPLLFPTFRAPCPTPYRLPPDVSSEEALDYYVARAEDVLAEHHERIAAFIVEPLIQGAAGIIVHPSEYLRRIRELTR
ncbi:MAG: aminotransferase class III-fold pyridoxal phosphate-dependent enzyme, partial [Planctomycetales bacterium]